MDKPYGKCTDCEAVHATKEDSSRHGQETMVPTGETSGVTARGHRTLVLNPPREDVVRRQMALIIQDATVEAADDLAREVEAGTFTAEEAKEFLKGYPDFEEAWEEIADEVS